MQDGYLSIVITSGIVALLLFIVFYYAYGQIRKPYLAVEAANRRAKEHELLVQIGQAIADANLGKANRFIVRNSICTS